MSRGVVIAYQVLFFLFALFSYLFVDNNFFHLHSFYTGFYIQKRELTTLLFLLFTTAFFIFYFYFLFCAKKHFLSLPIFKKLLITSCVFGLLAYPAMLSYDIFNYIATAKVTYFYHENPYVIMPVELINNKDLIFTRAANKLALYGPIWILLTSIPYILSFGSYIFALLDIKLLLVVFYVATVFLIWMMTKNLFSITFFALNPLVLFEVLVSGHNDIVMMFLALSAFYFIFKKRIFLGIVLFILSVLIKYATLPLAPVIFLASYRILMKKKVVWEKYMLASAVIMFCMVLLSAFREEVYPWYAIWFLSFVSLLPKMKFLIYFSIIFSGSLLLRYTPFMLWGTYGGLTPITKLFLGFVPLFLFVIYVLVFKRVWLKDLFQ